MLDTGDRVPDLPLALSSGKASTLGDYAGKWLVLYFYPKDSTPACTTEGLDFNTLLPKFRRASAEVLGVSKDSLKSHQNFCAKQGFRFELVSDADANTTRSARDQNDFVHLYFSFHISRTRRLSER